MAILSVIESTDSDVILIKYSLIGETFNNITVYPSPVSISNGVVLITPVNTNHSGAVNITGTFTLTIPLSQFVSEGLAWEGVYMFELNTQSTTDDKLIKSYGSILLGKTIDCCIADKMYTVVDCDCTDDKCNESLLDAQKMFLFRRSAEFVLRSLSNMEGPSTMTAQASLQDAQNKYDKAVELCSSGCGCKNSNSVSSGSGGY